MRDVRSLTWNTHCRVSGAETRPCPPCVVIPLGILSIRSEAYFLTENCLLLIICTGPTAQAYKKRKNHTLNPGPGGGKVLFGNGLSIERSGAYQWIARLKNRPSVGT